MTHILNLHYGNYLGTNAEQSNLANSAEGINHEALTNLSKHRGYISMRKTCSKEGPRGQVKKDKVCFKKKYILVQSQVRRLYKI